MIRPIKQPRRIDPSLVEVGDDISVEHPMTKGIITILRGVVHHRSEGGSTRYYHTEEGATLFAYDPTRTNKVKIVLYGRDEMPQSTLFETAEELKERIAS